MSKQTVQVNVNGKRVGLEVEPRTLLAYALRDSGLTGTHVGCDSTSCGACTVLVDGAPIKSCTMFAVQAEDAEVTTIEGMGGGANLHPLQQAFWDQHGLQCGYCTPGMILTSHALLQDNPDPSEDEIRFALSGNLCRCTGYNNIVKAVQQAAETLSKPAQAAD